jgi:hypothetical protein
LHLRYSWFIASSKGRPTRTDNAPGFVRAIAAAKNAGMEAGKRFLAGLQAYAKVNQGVMDEIAHLKAEAIPDAQQRDIALANVHYDREAREAKEHGADPVLVEQARQQAIANIKDRYAREAAEKAGREAQQAADQRLRAEEQTQEEIARLKIEATKTGIEKERALLELKHKEELKRAQEMGMNLDLIRRKQALEDKLLENGGKRIIGTSEVGTFDSHNLAQLGTGNGILDKTEGHLADMKEDMKQLVAINQRIERNMGDGIVLG